MADYEKGKYWYVNSEKESTVHENKSFNIGAFNLAADPELYDIQRTNTFEFWVYGIENLPPVADGLNSKSTGEQAGEILRLSCESCDVPSYTQDPIVVSRGNTEIRFAGKPRFSGTLNLTFNDYIGAGSLETLKAWQNCSGNMKTQKVGLAADYKKDCVIAEYTPTWQPVRQWNLHGCWISSLTVGGFSYADSNKRTINVTLAYDYAELVPADEETEV